MTKLGDSKITAEYLAEKLQDGNDTKTELKDAKVSVIGEEGFASNIFKVTFSWTQKCDLPTSAVVKLPTSGRLAKANKNLALADEDMTFYLEKVGKLGLHQLFTETSHSTEIRLYNLLGSEPPICIPKIYFSQPFDTEKEQQGILMMEDLSDIASVSKIGQSLTLEQVLSATDQLAYLHAFCLTKLEKGWEKPFTCAGNDQFKQISVMLQHMLNVAHSLGKMYPERFEEFGEKLKLHLTHMSLMKAFASYMWLGTPQVLVLGDMFVCNLLWDKNNPNQLRAILDFQSARPGNVAEDIARLLATSVSAELRRNHLDTILDHYHRKLCEKLGYEPYSLEMVHRSYKAIQPVTNLYMSFGLPLFINADSISGQGEEKKVANEAMLDRARACLEDYVTNQGTFELTLGETLYWYPMQFAMWLYFYFFM